MRRRDFISGIAGSAAAWPLAARAQQAGHVPRIGVVTVNAENDPVGQLRIATFRQSLQKLGWIEGQNIRIDYRWGVGTPESARVQAEELLSLKPDAILANGSPATAALQRATRSVAIVFVVVTDPVGAGFVQSQARPGGNITGFSTFEPEIGGKWLELLKEITPNLRRVAGISDPSFKAFAAVWRAVENLAPQSGIQATSVIYRNTGDDLESALAQFGREPGGGLIVLPTAINNFARKSIFSFAASHRLPAVYPFRHYATDGGLMSYGFDPPDLYRRSASYIDRILKGEKPADLPVQAPTKFELIINLKTAKALDLAVAPRLLARADEVIE
ncbi:MAG: ABC transporter substrate-binding protein [Xanthobacteraceae bacterium]